MEVATTNNHHNHSHPHHHHNHNHNHHQHHHHQRMPNSNNTTSNNNISNGVMATSDDGGGVVGGGVGGGPRSPFQREVHEWQRIDPDTGAMVSGRLEADRWIAGPLNSYGKISDSQNFTQPNGTQHSQRKQLEVLQAHTTGGGAMQVIRAQTVQTTSSRWSSTSSPLSQPPTNTPAITQTPTSPPTTLTTRAIAPIILPSTTSLSLSSSASSLLSSSSSPPPSPPVTMTNDFSNAHHEQSHYHHISHQQPKWPTASSTQAATQMSVNVGDNERDRHHHHQHHHHYGDDDADHDHDHDYHDDNDNNEHHQSYLINGVSNRLYSGSSNNNSNNSNNNSNLLLLDTEPSLKLSNLMKSSSSISSNNSSSNNSLIAAATATMNTHHKSATGKISLHAIVGNTSNQNNEIKSSSSSATTATSKRQQQQQRSSRLFEQPAIYGKNSNANGWSKSRVGVNNDSNEAATATSTATAAATICGNGAGSFADELRHRQLTPTHSDRQQSQQPRRVFESFRHGFASTLKSSAHTNHHHHNDDNDHDEERDHNNVDDDDDGDDDNLRLTARHQRRQQVPPALIVEQPTSAASLYRSRSISTDDLSTEWDTNGGAAEEEPGEWRRVSKLRRSFQSPGTHDAGGSSSNATAYYNTTSANLLRRPLDLPTNSVSVSKIRAELENGRRLNTAMRNNHVDLAALDTILNASADTKPVPAKRTTFLTAESLKEIRGKLKKLSDESLYKEDFMAHQQLPVTEEHIEVQHHMRKPDASTELRQLRQLRQLTPEESPEITPPKSAFQTVVQRSLSIGQQQLQSAAPTTATRTTNSLESRQKYKDSSSTEWHSRRKSYGFEKMSPPDDRTMFRMDASTDSGLGRSGELGNWSPTESSASAGRGTVIHFGEPPKTVVNTPKIQRRYRPLKSPDEAEEETLKRHSIAVVDESQYVRENLRKTSHVHLNGLYEGGEAAGSQTLQTVQSSASSTTLFQRGQQKRVEFCKTEVHFAAESGRVNIVETDGKPPPTQNFRRRRRTASGPLQSLVKSASTVSSSSTSTTTTNSSVALPITLFGDDKRGKSIASPAAAYNAAPGDAALDEELEPINVTVSMPKLLEAYESSRSSYASTSGIDTTDNETDEFSAIRGILKNKPIKPKPYHLGENIESPDALWGVQLKSINGSINKRENVAKGPSPTAGTSASSVAERIRVVETRQEHTSAATTSSSLTNGYSTKINLSLGDTQKDWMDAEVPTSNVMSIELHSPLSSEQPETMAPVAKPRTLAAVHQSQQPKVHTATTVKQYAQPTTELAKEPLKIIKEARGARKLKEHELSYFGVQVNVNNNSNSPKAKLLTLNTNLNASPKRTLPQRKPPLSEDKTIKQSDDIKSQAMKWQLLNDKPDLLRHSPSTVDAPQNTTRPAANLEAMPRKSLHSTPSRRSPVHELSDTDDEDDEHFYENISNELTPVFKVKTSNSVDTNSYDRKTDLKRDAQILSEMTRNADQTLKALTDEAAHKDQRRRSLQRRTAKPLETIDEKTITEKIPHDRCIAVKVSRSTVASEAKRTSRHSTPSPTTVASRTRTSSQSSLEENTCPRARSRSLSSEREYENVKVKRTSTAPAKARLTKPTAHSRSSSRESYRSSHTQCSSGDEVCKREERVRHVRPKRSSSSSTTTRDNRQHDREHERECQQRDDSKSQRHRLSTAEKQQQQRTSSTTRSSQKERTECSTDPRHSSSSSRRRKEEHDSLRSTRSSTTGGRTSSSEKHERSSSGRALVRSTRGHEHADEAHHRSSHRSERTEKDKDKDSVKPVRSKGHASRSTPHSNERSGTLAQQHKATATPTKIRDHRKSSTATTTTTTTTKNNSESHKQQQTQDILTHSKNQQMVNGHDIHYHNNNQNRHNHQQQPHHVHNLTTTTIAAKHRERNGKDRK